MMKDDNDSESKKHFIDVFPLCNKTCQRYLIYVLWLFLILLPIHEYYHHQILLPLWDLLLFTGVLTLILGLHLAADARKYFEFTLTRLLTRNILQIDEKERNEFFERLEKHAQHWARIGGNVVASAILCAFVLALLQHFWWERVLLGIALMPVAYIAGTYLGRMSSYGHLGWQLKKESVKIMLQPTHVDGVAGLKPIGDFFFYQAMVTAIPAIFLAAWWFLFPIWPREYSHWEDPYIILLSIAILIEILAFLIPIWSFHRIMICEKKKWLEEADRLSNEITAIEHTLESGQSLMQSEQIEEMKKYYWSIENMAIWPVDIKTKRQFKLNNILMFIPLIGDIAKRSFDWKHILAILKQLG